MPSVPIDTSCQAEFEDGYLHDETELKDVSAFSKGHNVFHDIYNKLCEADHGRMVRFSVFYKNERHDIDWRNLPHNARPIRFRHGMHTWYADGSEVWGFTGVDLGYQYQDDNGKNIKEVKELR